MMSKLLYGIMTVFLAVSFCFGAAACVPPAIVNKTAGGTSNDGGQGDPQDIVGDKLTAEEWAAAFDDKNFENYKMVMEEFYYEEGSPVNRVTTIVIAGNVGYGKNVQTGIHASSSSVYIEKNNDGTVFRYTNSQGKWYKDLEHSDYDRLEYWFGTTAPMAFGESYDKCQYSAEQDGYVFHESLMESESTGLLKFKDGKLVFFKSETKVAGQDWIAKMNITFTYGGQAVTLPVAELSPWSMG